MPSFVMLSPVTTLVLVTASILPRVCSAYACFFPDGGTANNYVACSPNGDGSCCQEGDFCTQFGYCVSNSKGYHYRGACTDSTWGNPSCPDYCLTNENSGNSTSVNVIACSAAISGGTWCCAYDGNCCSNSTFTPGFGTIFAAGSTPSPTAPLSSQNSVSQTMTVTIQTAASTAAPGTMATTSPLPTTSNSPSSNKTATIVGCAVGIPLGIIALIGIIFFVTERKKRKMMADTTWDRLKATRIDSNTSGSIHSGQQPLRPPIQVSTGAPVYVVREQSSSHRQHELPAQGRTHELTA